MRLLRESPSFAELAFHVLAHVRRSADLPSSLYDAEWVRFAERRLGSAAARTLAEDADALGRLVTEHEAFARLQLLCWLFRDLERACGAFGRELAELTPAEVDEPELLAPLAALGPGAELLFLAAALERPYFTELPAAQVDWAAAEAALASLLPLAPALGGCSVALLRPLRLRGRVRGSLIWVGAPDAALGLAVEHVAWQAAHEATVREVALAERASERRVEHMAVVLLAERAARQGRAAEHARWLGHFGPNAPDTRVEALGEAEARAVRALLERQDPVAGARSGT